MALRIILKRLEQDSKAPMINDEDDFKSSKRGVARKEARSTKRKRRQVLKDSDSEDDAVPVKKPAATNRSATVEGQAPGKSPASSKVPPGKSPASSSKVPPGKSPASFSKVPPGKSPASFSKVPPGKSPASSKVVGKSPASSKVVGKSPASSKVPPGKSPASSRVAQKAKSSPLSSKAKKKNENVTTLSDFFGKAPIKRSSRQLGKMGEDIDSKLSPPPQVDAPEGRNSHTPSEVVMVPESPAPSGGDVREGCSFPTKKLKLMMDRVVDIPSSRPTPSSPRKQLSMTPTKAMPTKTPIKATPTKTPIKATPTKKPIKATFTKTPTKATPIKTLMPTKTPTKATPTKMARAKKTTTPTKNTPPKGTRSSPRLREKNLVSQDPVSSPLNPHTPVQSTLKLSKRAATSKRAIQYLELDDSGDVLVEQPPATKLRRLSGDGGALVEPPATKLRRLSGDGGEPPATKLRRLSGDGGAQPPATKCTSSNGSVSRISESPTGTAATPPTVAPPSRPSSKPFVCSPLPLQNQQAPPKQDGGHATPKRSTSLPKRSFSPPKRSTSLPKRSSSPQKRSSSLPKRSTTPKHSISPSLPPPPLPQNTTDSRCSITPKRSIPATSLSPPPFPPLKKGSGSRHSITPKRSLSSSSPQPQPNRNDNFIKYLNRSGPKHLGSKVIPEGADNCLGGLTFVITGVLDSMEREEAAELVKKYGGKVTNSVSGRTSFLVAGEDAGESKLAKAEKAGTSRIDEDGLLALIRTRPASKTGSSGKGTKKKSSSVAREVGVAQRSGTFYGTASGSAEGVATGERSDVAISHSVPASAVSAMSKISDKEKSPECLLWVDKYRPLSTQKIVGQQGQNSNANKLSRWLQNWGANHPVGGPSVKKPAMKGVKDKDGACFKAALLSGPPGIGKTTTAQLVCKENGFSYVETNASSSRNKSAIRGHVSSQLSSLSITAFLGGQAGGVASGRLHAVIMDEVDGMDGNADRGGISELISLIKTSNVPVICICNDRQKPSIRTLVHHCFDLPFQRPNVKQICAAVRSVCFKEGISIEPQALTEMVTASGQDIRQVLHNLSLWSATDEPDTPLKMDVAMEAARNAKKHMKMNPFNVVRAVFDPREGERELSLIEKSDLFFHDYSLASLFVQENYVRAHPHSAKGSLQRHLRCVALAADALCDGDVMERTIRKDSRWGLLPHQAFQSSVIPGEHMKGFLGRPVFPQWLGMRSKTGRCDRLLQELQMHTRLITSCNKTEFGMEYLPFLAAKLTQPLVAKGDEGVAEVVTDMHHYDLQREDWESLTELAHYSGRPEITSQIPSKVKAAFTRKFNKTDHLSHYASTASAKKRSRSQDEEGEGQEEEGGAESAEENDGIDKNPMIKTVRGKKDEGTSGKGKGKGKDGGGQSSKAKGAGGGKKASGHKNGKGGRENNGKKMKL